LSHFIYFVHALFLYVKKILFEGKIMSSRPSRVRKEPDTFLPTNFRGNETRKKAKTSTVTKTPAKKQTGGEKRKRQNVNIFNVLNQVGKNNNTKAFNMLYSIYKDTNLPKLKKTLSSLKNTTPEQFINEQFKILNKNVRSNGDKNTLNLELSGTDDKLDLCFLIWLDMRHDAKASMKDVSFEKFLNNKDSPLKTIIKNPPAFQMTDLMNKMIDLKILKDLKNPSARTSKEDPRPWERKIKDHLPELFGIEKPNIISSQKAYGFDTENPINISIDSEGSKSAISTLIANNKRQVNNKTTRYPLRSIISIANRVDPGNTMPTGGVQQEWTKLFDNSGDLKSTQIYNVSDCEFKIGDTNLELTSGTKGTFNMTVNGISIKVGSTAPNVSKSNASNEVRVSKFLGDFMQILTVCSKPQQGKVTAFGTVDGVAAGMYTFISKRLMKQEPRLFIDMYINQGNVINVYGFSHLLNTRRNAKQSVINTYIGNKGNTGNNVSSGRSRTISGNGASNGNITVSRNGASNGNITISGNSGNSGNSTNTNMLQPLRKKQKPATNINNTLTLASAIGNYSYKNKNNNNNEVTSGFTKMNINAASAELNKLTSLRQNQKNNYLEKMKKNPSSILDILNNAKRLANTQRVINNARLELNKLIFLRQNQKSNYLEKMKQNPSNIPRILNIAKRLASTKIVTRSQTSARNQTPK
jgi:hypothetical protein